MLKTFVLLIFKEVVMRLKYAMFAVLFLAVFVFAQTIQYQGKLTSGLGISIDDTVSMKFVIYNSATGGDSL